MNVDYSASSTAVIDSESGASYSYRQLGTDIRRVAQALDFKTKSLAFCFCRNDYDTLCAYLGSVEAGHAAALLDPEASLQTRLIDSYRPDFILRSARSALTTYTDYELISTRGPLIWRHRDPRPESPIRSDLALLLSTSGSTGTPKFVKLTRTNLLTNAQAIVRGLNIKPGDSAITSLPFNYSYGLSVINTHLVAGAKLVLTPESLTSRDFWNVIRETQCTSFAGVPYSYHLLRRLGLPGGDFPSLTKFTQAGGKLALAEMDYFFQSLNSRGQRFFIMYGQTEATARISILSPEHLPDKLGSVGRPICSGAIQVLQASGSTSGTIIYTGPNVMLGYALTRSDLSGGDQLKGVLNTGDLGYLDSEGYLFVTGRLSRYAKVCGLRVNLDEVESLIKPYGPAAAVGIEDKLVIFCEGTQETLLTHHRNELARKLSLHHRLLECRLISTLPLKSNGKVDYTSLEEAARC